MPSSINLKEFYRVSREHMVCRQVVPVGITDWNVLNALNAVPREKFVPERIQPRAYMDQHIFIDSYKFFLKPVILGTLLEKAHFTKDDFVLNLNCQGGYTTFILAQLAKMVVGIEKDINAFYFAEDFQEENQIDNVAFFNTTDLTFLKKQSLFDVIFIDSVLPRIPEHIEDYLKDSGRLVCVTLPLDSDIGIAGIYIKKQGVLEQSFSIETDLKEFPRILKIDKTESED